MPRLMLNDELWAKLKPVMLKTGIYDRKELRTLTEGILFRLRTGCPWRDLPKEFGKWNTVYKRFNEWSREGKLMALFKLLVKNPDLEWEFIDGSIVKAHQHSSGAPRHEESAIGKSVAGHTSKIHLAVEANGLPIHFEITGGQVHDCKAAPEFIAKLPSSKYLMADRGYDSESLRQQIREKESIPLIPRKKNSVLGNKDFNWNLYKYRHLVENAFARLKHFRSIATRYDKLKRNYAGMLAFACTLVWL